MLIIQSTIERSNSIMSTNNDKSEKPAPAAAPASAPTPAPAPPPAPTPASPPPPPPFDPGWSDFLKKGGSEPINPIREPAPRQGEIKERKG